MVHHNYIEILTEAMVVLLQVACEYSHTKTLSCVFSQHGRSFNTVSLPARLRRSLQESPGPNADFQQRLAVCPSESPQPPQCALIVPGFIDGCPIILLHRDL